jgi:hypothetical protein
MTRTITIGELKSTGVDTWSVKDSSVRGYTTKYASEVKPGDKVVIDNYFTLVTENNTTKTGGKEQ